MFAILDKSADRSEMSCDVMPVSYHKKDFFK